MASLTKHPKSKYFTACYTDKDGRRVKRSTKSTDRNTALRIAIEWEEAEQKAREGNLTKAQLTRILSELSERATGDGIQVPSVEKYLTDWVASKELSGVSPGTIERYAKTIKVFVTFLGDKAKMPISGLTPTHVQDFVDFRRKEGSAPLTVIVDTKTLGAAFKRAEDLSYILKNPTRLVTLPKKVSSERYIFTHEQFVQLVDAPAKMFKKSFAAVVNWRTLILLGYYTGARLTDCVRMKFEHVNLQRGVIVVFQQKTKKWVPIPMHFDLYHHVCDLINMRDEITKDDYLCGNLFERGTGGKHGLSETFLRIVKHAGIEQDKVQGMGKRNFNRLTFHSLRHSFNTALYVAGIPQEDRMRLTGHSSIAMNNRYTHLIDDKRLHKAIDVLPRLTPEDAQTGS